MSKMTLVAFDAKLTNDVRNCNGDDNELIQLLAKNKGNFLCYDTSSENDMKQYVMLMSSCNQQDVGIILVFDDKNNFMTAIYDYQEDSSEETFQEDYDDYEDVDDDDYEWNSPTEDYEEDDEEEEPTDMCGNNFTPPASTSETQPAESVNCCNGCAYAKQIADMINALTKVISGMPVK